MRTELGGPVSVPVEPAGHGRFEGEPVLSIRDLSVAYRTSAGDVRAVDRVSLDLNAGEVIGLVGESGSGKSTLAYGATRLLRAPAVITSGSVRYQGHRMDTPTDVLQLTAEQLARAALAGDRHRFPERDERAEPGTERARPDDGRDPRAPAAVPARGDGKGGRPAGDGRHRRATGCAATRTSCPAACGSE